MAVPRAEFLLRVVPPLLVHLLLLLRSANGAEPDPTSAPNDTSGHRPQLPVILGWNSFFGSGNIMETIAPQEQVQWCRRQCVYSRDRNDADRASAIVFHANGGYDSLPAKRRPQQLYVFFDLESPPHTSMGEPYPHFFNLSMTYRADDEHNLIAPYGGLQRVNISRREDLADRWTEVEIEAKIALKHKLALQIVSNCAPQSGRHLYTEALQRYVNVTGYGRCFGRNCDTKCYDQEIDSHFFYLAFENSVCKQYVTEKFWNAFRHLTVPVVLSRRALRGLNIPPGAFIAADDFKNVQQLAAYLEKVRNDKKRYRSFFNWTHFYRRKSDVDPPDRAICRLCELAHQKLAPGSRVIPDLRKYWHEGGQCEDDFARRFIANRTQSNQREESQQYGDYDSGEEQHPPPRGDTDAQREERRTSPAQQASPLLPALQLWLLVCTVLLCLLCVGTLSKLSRRFILYPLSPLANKRHSLARAKYHRPVNV